MIAFGAERLIVRRDHLHGCVDYSGPRRVRNSSTKTPGVLRVQETRRDQHHENNDKNEGGVQTAYVHSTPNIENGLQAGSCGFHWLASSPPPPPRLHGDSFIPSPPFGDAARMGSTPLNNVIAVTDPDVAPSVETIKTASPFCSS